jgi:hypothetical protein
LTRAHPLRIRDDRGFVLLDRLDDVALPLKRRGTIRKGGGVVAKAAHARNDRIVDRGPRRAVLLGPFERLLGIIDAAKSPEHHATRVPRCAEFGKEPHGGIELSERRFVCSQFRERSTKAIACVWFGRAARQALVLTLRPVEIAGLEEGVRQCQSGRQRRRRDLHGLGQQSRRLAMMRQPGLDEAA